MRIAALSDFHIGVRDGVDGFRHDPGRFSAFLDRLERGHDAILLLGDIFQTDHTMLPTDGARRRHLEMARARLGALGHRLQRPPYVYVHGNHDLVAAQACGAPEHVRLGDETLWAFFIHGHQFDPVARRAPALAHFGTWATGRLRAAGLPKVAAYFERRDVDIKHARFRGPAGPYVRAGRDLARRWKANVVVMGHTHVSCIDRVPEGLVVNTGTCSGGRFEYVSIDTRARTVTLCRGHERQIVRLDGDAPDAGTRQAPCGGRPKTW